MTRRSIVGLVMLFVAIAIVSGCPGPDNSKLCCNEDYPDPNSSGRNYCGDVAMVATDFIFDVDSLDARRDRQNEIAALLDRIEHCDNEQCIRTTVDTSAVADDFDSLFIRQLDASDTEETLAAGERPDAIKCGLRHAVGTKLK